MWGQAAATAPTPHHPTTHHPTPIQRLRGGRRGRCEGVVVSGGGEMGGDVLEDRRLHLRAQPGAPAREKLPHERREEALDDRVARAAYRRGSDSAPPRWTRARPASERTRTPPPGRSGAPGPHLGADVRERSRAPAGPDPPSPRGRRRARRCGGCRGRSRRRGRASLARPDLLDIGAPAHVWRGRGEVAPDQIRRHSGVPRRTARRDRACAASPRHPPPRLIAPDAAGAG